MLAISMGSSRELASGTRDGAHSADCENADEPCIPAWPRPASTRAPCGRQAVTTCAQPGPQSAASGARSYGQSDGCTLAVSVTMTPQPPAARRA